jgi:hypothetical protein
MVTAVGSRPWDGRRGHSVTVVIIAHAVDHRDVAARGHSAHSLVICPPELSEEYKSTHRRKWAANNRWRLGLQTVRGSELAAVMIFSAMFEASRMPSCLEDSSIIKFGKQQVGLRGEGSHDGWECR